MMRSSFHNFQTNAQYYIISRVQTRGNIQVAEEEISSENPIIKYTLILQIEM